MRTPMISEKRRRFAFGLLSLTLVIVSGSVGIAPGATDPARLGKPSPEQLAWHAMEIEMFLCLDPCTWQGREYDNHSTPLPAINPARLDTEQWCRVAESFGAKQILFVAKHTGGFCWWQTATSDYSIKNTPWNNGKGDVLAELAASCRKHGLRLGIYVYPGDDTWGAPMGSGGKTKDPAKQEAYNKVFRQQLTEVLTRYGEISEVWFDGSCVIEVGDILKQHSPKAVVFQGPHATLRWPGNEAGVSPYPAWQTVKRADAATGVATALHSDPDGDVWLPMEMDTTLLDHKWFWGPNTDPKLKSLDQLMDIYAKSVGRGGVLLLNSTPDTNGVIPEAHVKRYAEFGREIQRRFSKPLGETNGAGRSVELDLGKATWVDHVITMEDIREGQRVRGYVIEAQVEGAWRELLRASSVGYKKIDPFPPVKAARLRFTATESVGEPLIHRFAAFFADVPVKLETKSAKGKSASDWNEIARWNRQSIGTDWTTLNVDLTPHIPQVGQYEVEFLQTGGGARLEIQSATVLLEGVEAPQACTRRGDSNVFVVSRSQVTEGKGVEKTVLRLRARLTGADESAGVARIRRVF